MKPDEGVSVVLFAPVARLMFRLPRCRKWTRRDRDRWLNAFRAVVDLMIEVIDE